VHRSHRKSGTERLLSLIGGEIRRCHDCRVRQVWFGALGYCLKTEGVTGGRLRSIAMLGSTFVLCFLFIWWMITRFTELAG
jgi:hypothetical protein